MYFFGEYRNTQFDHSTTFGRSSCSILNINEMDERTSRCWPIRKVAFGRKIFANFPRPHVRGSSPSAMSRRGSILRGFRPRFAKFSRTSEGNVSFVQKESVRPVRRDRNSHSTGQPDQSAGLPYRVNAVNVQFFSPRRYYILRIRTYVCMYVRTYETCKCEASRK